MYQENRTRERSHRKAERKQSTSAASCCCCMSLSRTANAVSSPKTATQHIHVDFANRQRDMQERWHLLIISHCSGGRKRHARFRILQSCLSAYVDEAAAAEDPRVCSSWLRSKLCCGMRSHVATVTPPKKLFHPFLNPNAKPFPFHAGRKEKASVSLLIPSRLSRQPLYESSSILPTRPSPRTSNQTSPLLLQLC